LVGAKVGETKTVYVTFPPGLRDKTLAGKKADLIVNYEEEQEFDEKMMEELAQQSLEREEQDAAKAAAADSTEA